MQHDAYLLLKRRQNDLFVGNRDETTCIYWGQPTPINFGKTYIDSLFASTFYVMNNGADPGDFHAWLRPH